MTATSEWIHVFSDREAAALAERTDPPGTTIFILGIREAYANVIGSALWRHLEAGRDVWVDPDGQRVRIDGVEYPFAAATGAEE